VPSLLAAVEIHLHGWNVPGGTLLFTLLAVVVGFQLLGSLLKRQQPRRPETLHPFVPAPSGSASQAISESTATTPANPAAPILAPRQPRKSRADKRRALRRTGAAVPIHVRGDAADTPIQGLVLNRSRGGLLVRLVEERAAGTTLSIRPLNGHEETPWVQIVVRHAQKTKDCWLLGCAFQEQLPWNVLLLFG
jgi:hypothetical protein